TTTRQRFHNATGLGPLTQPRGAQPHGRVTYVATYPDGIGRPQATANYGTNGDVTLVRPAVAPTSSATVLVTLTLYNSRGEPYQSIDPAGTITLTTLDDAGRRVQLIENYRAASSSSSSSGGGPPVYDQNRTANWTWTADDNIATITGVNGQTGNQTTAYGYGTTLRTSDVARNDVLSSLTYADAGAANYLVNRQSEVKQRTEQTSTVHQYSLDFLGRQIEDAITALGTGVDGTVQRIGATYEVRGNVQNVTSFSSPTVGQGTVVNDIQCVYNSFMQLVTEYQEHNGAVNTSTSVNVQYQYANGSANTIRPTAIVYPNGRVLSLSYGTSGGMDDALSRVASLIDSDGVTHLADYTRLGLATIVEANSPQPQIAWSLINGTGTDPYTGLDQFNRVVDNRWFSTATNADLDRIQHGYDLASNRLWRKNTVADAAVVYLDEFYQHDGLYRLAYLQRGQLNSTNTGVVPGTQSFTQQRVLDPTGNWVEFQQSDPSGTLDQFRSANTVNEITGISSPGVTPFYDAVGNMVSMPQPANPTAVARAVFDAWSRV
ncbi:MAG TPA: hypothetical protein PK867_17785, partial [Pirellulales bacterium]|nr:hypothetical protein [Pirellulales bacterium]